MKCEVAWHECITHVICSFKLPPTHTHTPTPCSGATLGFPLWNITDELFPIIASPHKKTAYLLSVTFISTSHEVRHEVGTVWTCASLACLVPVLLFIFFFVSTRLSCFLPQSTQLSVEKYGSRVKVVCMTLESAVSDAKVLFVCLDDK